MKNNVSEKDNVFIALDKVCQDVRERIIEQPSPEELTAALVSLFPFERLIPQGSLVVIRENQKRWTIEERNPVLTKPDTAKKSEKIIWLKRKLSSYM